MKRDKADHQHATQTLNRELIKELSRPTSRASFFQTLSRLLRRQFSFDRLCINLYDPNSELLSYFAAAEGTVVNALSPVRKAEKTTVAGHVIASRKPVVITDIAQHFAESMLHPMSEAGLTTTMAFPLILNDVIIATLHCSFVHKPDNIYSIMELLLEICPYVAACLGALLAMEQLEQGLAFTPLRPGELPDMREDFIFESPRMRQFMHMVHKVASLDMPVLLLGETGSGKTHLARRIHRLSKRSKQDFVRVNCPALATNLFESELFGHAKGAFTGASVKRVGRVELAHQGTLFLDEIAELNQEMQSKLLHVLEDMTFERVGESVSLSVDARMIAATNVSVPEALRDGRLRSDFYYRLSSCALELPPLRERREDIPILASYFINQLSAQHGLPKARLSAAVTEVLLGHSWPGNIRELRNVVSRLLLKNCIADALTKEDARQAVLTDMDQEEGPACPSRETRPTPAPATIRTPCAKLRDMERDHILQALRQAGGVVSGPRGAAALLDLPRSTLQHRMRKLGIHPRGMKRA